VLDKLPGRRENLPEGTDLVVGAIEDPKMRIRLTQATCLSEAISP